MVIEMFSGVNRINGYLRLISFFKKNLLSVNQTVVGMLGCIGML